MLRPGLGYTSPPLVFVDGRSDIAEAVINEDGFVVSLKIKDRTTTFASTPEVVIVGGEGYGAKFIPSLVCLDTEELEVVGSTQDWNWKTYWIIHNVKSCTQQYTSSIATFT